MAGGGVIQRLYGWELGRGTSSCSSTSTRPASSAAPSITRSGGARGSYIYPLSLRCFVVLEFKARAFVPEYAGKMNFYLSAVDDLLRHPTDQPSIGISLCKEKNNMLVEYAPRDVGKPMGVADWETRLVDPLPEDLQGRPPSVEEMESELMGRRE